MPDLARTTACALVCGGCCMYIFTILVWLRTTHAIAWPYSVIFLPVFLTLCLFCAGSAASCFFWVTGSEYETEWEDAVLNVVKAIAATLFVAFLVVRFETLRLSWFQVFLPIFIYAIISTVLGCRTKERRRQSHGAIFVLSFCVFAVLKLEGVVAWSWWFIFSTVWFLFGLLCLAMTGFSIAWAVTLCGSELDEDLKSERAFLLVTALAILSVFTPLGFFFVFLVGYVDGTFDRPVSSIFLPLVIFETFVLCLLCSGVVLALKARDEEEAALYWKADDGMEKSSDLKRLLRGSSSRSATAVEMENILGRDVNQGSTSTSRESRPPSAQPPLSQTPAQALLGSITPHTIPDIVFGGSGRRKKRRRRRRHRSRDGGRRSGDGDDVECSGILLRNRLSSDEGDRDPTTVRRRRPAASQSLSSSSSSGDLVARARRRPQTAAKAISAAGDLPSLRRRNGDRDGDHGASDAGSFV